jgi:hypothetical protein
MLRPPAGRNGEAILIPIGWPAAAGNPPLRGNPLAAGRRDNTSCGDRGTPHFCGGGLASSAGGNGRPALEALQAPAAPELLHTFAPPEEAASMSTGRSRSKAFPESMLDPSVTVVPELRTPARALSSMRVAEIVALAGAPRASTTMPSPNSRTASAWVRRITDPDVIASESLIETPISWFPSISESEIVAFPRAPFSRSDWTPIPQP